MQAIAGHDPRDPASADRPVPDHLAALASPDLKGVRLVIPRAMFERDCPASGAMGSAFDAAVEVLRGLGAAIDVILLPTCSCSASSAPISTTAGRCICVRST